MKKSFSLTLLFCALAFALSVSAQKNQFVERVVETTTNEKNQIAAKKELFDKAIEKVTQDLVVEVIGEAKLNRNRTLINDKVFRKSGRFIPYSKPGELAQTPEGYKMLVTLKVNLEEFQKMLRENGLLYESDSTPSVLPAVRWLDKVNGKEFAWWSGVSEENGFLAKEALALEAALKTSFAKQNFYFSRPQAYRYYQLLPQAYRSGTLRTEDWQALAPVFQSQVVVEGQIGISGLSGSEAHRIEVRLTAFQVINGRVIADVVRQFDTMTGSFELAVDKKMREASESLANDLSTQVLDAWQKGAIGASLYRLTIRGRMPILEQEALKETLRSRLKELKSINERMISMDSIVYEIDSSVGPQEIAKKLPNLSVGPYQLVVESANEKEATYKVQREGAKQ